MDEIDVRGWSQRAAETGMRMAGRPGSRDSQFHLRHRASGSLVMVRRKGLFESAGEIVTRPCTAHYNKIRLVRLHSSRKNQNLNSLPFLPSRSRSIFWRFFAISFATMSEKSSLFATPADPRECASYLRRSSSSVMPSNSPASRDTSTPFALRCNRETMVRVVHTARSSHPVPSCPFRRQAPV